MRIFNESIYARGTLGDAFMIVLKVLANRDKIKTINHFSKHDYAYPSIGKIYNLLEDIEVNFLKKPLREPCINGYLEPHETWEPHPVFQLPNVDKFNLPPKFNVVQLSSGLNQVWRKLRDSDLKYIPKTEKLVVLGTDTIDAPILKDYDCIDLRRSTALDECLSIIAQAEAFYGPQGLLSFFALSQKVKTNIFLKNEVDWQAVKYRIGMIPEWQEHVQYY